ncbi:RIP metalloprotease RseP [uncultured Ruminococcus sp.]|uniref:RIP metalloprotease RseP n=1 Tax=uncultured Ruminococcus sp. TaxID=165186 RepID=UPI00292E8AE5|nr:RIP metalloprotease RseP [uncultured Ruminococcus sp.]
MIAVALFELIIFLHEGGHFITAKKSGIKVNEFALGMGPKIFSFTKGETTYSLRLFPIGGYCAMEGEDEDSDNPRAFNNAAIWKRMIVIIAGAVMNILFGLVLMLITLLPQESFASTTVSEFSVSSFTAVTGLKSGDKIVEINDYAVNTSTDFSFALYTLPVTQVDGNELSVYKEDCAFDLYVRATELVDENTTKEQNEAVVKLLGEAQIRLSDTKSNGEAYAVFGDYYNRIAETLGKKKSDKIPTIEIRDTRSRFRTNMKVIRDGEMIELKNVDLLTLKKSADDDTPQLQVDFYIEPMEKDFGTVIQQTFANTVSVVRMVWGSLIGLIKGQFSLNEMSGPVGIASTITQVAGESLKTNGFGAAVNSIVYIMMIITVNLGVVNMLPFPALDGGRFLMLLIEWIFRKPVPRRVEQIINTVGLILLLGLSAVIAVKDVWKLFSGG